MNSYLALVMRAMTIKALLPALACLALAAPAAAQQAAPSPFAGLFTAWNATNRDALRAEAERRTPESESGAIPAYSGPQRSQAEAAALGERVAEVVRRGDCAQGERMAREAGDIPLLRAVRDYCRTNPS